MPELPEMEAWRRELDGPVSAFPIEKAGPAHIATLKTFDPPLAALEGRRLAGAERRAKRLLFPTEDGELVLLVHLMTAGRLRYLARGRERAEDARVPARVRGRRRARPDRGREEEARRGLAAHARGRPRPSSRTSARRRTSSDAAQLGEILARESRRLHSLLRDQRVIAGIGRAWANEILHAAKLSPVRALEGPRARGGRAARGGDRLGARARARAARARRERRERPTACTAKLGEPCYVCGTPIAQVDFEEHTIYYCPECQTGGRVLKDRRLSRLLR